MISRAARSADLANLVLVESRSEVITAPLHCFADGRWVKSKLGSYRCKQHCPVVEHDRGCVVAFGGFGNGASPFDAVMNEIYGHAATVDLKSSRGGPDTDDMSKFYSKTMSQGEK